VTPSDRDDRSDEQLVAALNGGDARAFDAIYYRHRDWVVRLALRFTGRDEDALDVLQETFAYFFRKFPGFVLTAKLTTFLYPVVRNLSIAARKRRRREFDEEELIEPQVPPQAVGGGREELAAVLKALPGGQREVVLMRFVDDMSLAEIGTALGIPEGTVKSRLHNALKALRADPRLQAYFLRG
jgi:RNA polymerase sigma-70 factor (ECF subfamily)